MNKLLLLFNDNLPNIAEEWPMYFGAPFGGYFGQELVETLLDVPPMGCTAILAAIALDTQPPNLVDIAAQPLACTVSMAAIIIDTYTLAETPLDVQPLGTTASIAAVTLVTQTIQTTLTPQPLGTVAVMDSVPLDVFVLVEITLDPQPMACTVTMAAVRVHTNNEPIFFTGTAYVKPFKSKGILRTFQSKAEVKN